MTLRVLVFFFSHVLAAYASFLWKTEDEEEGNSMQDCMQIPLLHEQVMNAAIA